MAAPHYNGSSLAPSKPSSTSYVSDSWDDDGAHFVHTFSKYTELIGFTQAKLFMSYADTDDLDTYVICRKLDASGKPLVQLNIPLEALPAGTKAEDVPDLNVFKYFGPNGRLRASHRELGTDPTFTWHSHGREEKIPPSHNVCLDIPLWPSGIVFEADESIRLEIKGHEVILPEFPAVNRVPTNLNRGKHFVHTGPEHPSPTVLSLASGTAVP